MFSPGSKSYIKTPRILGQSLKKAPLQHKVRSPKHHICWFISPMKTMIILYPFISPIKPSKPSCVSHNLAIKNKCILWICTQGYEDAFYRDP